MVLSKLRNVEYFFGTILQKLRDGSMKKYHRSAGLIWINQDVQRRQADFIMVRKDEMD